MHKRSLTDTCRDDSEPNLEKNLDDGSHELPTTYVVGSCTKMRCPIGIISQSDG